MWEGGGGGGLRNVCSYPPIVMVIEATGPSPTNFAESGSVRSRTQNSEEYYSREVGGVETTALTTKPQQGTNCVPQMWNGGMHCP